MVKKMSSIDVGSVEIPIVGQIEEFVISEIEFGELQEFVDPKIIREKFENAELTDPYYKVYSSNKKWGNVSELLQVPETVTYRHKVAKINKVYGALAIGTKMKYMYDGRNWGIVLPS